MDTGDPNELGRLPSSYYYLTISLSNNIRQPIPIIESAESTLAPVLVTESSHFVEDRFDLDRSRRPNDSLGSTRDEPVPE